MSSGSSIDGRAAGDFERLAGGGKDRAAHGVSRGSDPGYCRGAEQQSSGGARGHAPGDGQQVAGPLCAGGFGGSARPDAHA